MSIQKHPERKILLQVTHPLEQVQAIEPATHAQECNIELHVGDGWAIRGSYRNQILQRVTLQKTTSAEGS